MNEFDKNKKLETLLEETAEQLQPNVMFKAELEEKLRKAHKPRASLPTFAFRNWLPALTGIVVVGGLVIFMLWLFQTLEPQKSVGTNEEQPIEVQTTPGVIIDPNNTNSNETIGGYDYRGGKLFLTSALPESSATANIYEYIADQPVTIEEARALANQFGLQGEMYTTAFPQAPDKIGYVISDGKRMLTVYTKNYFTYTPDILVTDRGYYGVNNDNAETVISDFFNQNGLTFPFSISKSPAKGMYHFMQLSPDGIPMQYDIYTIQSSNVTLGQNGEVAYLSANMLSYNPQAFGSYGIISAEDALNAILDPHSTVGMTESGSGGEGGVIPQQWYREYPNNETVSISGSLIKYDSATAGQPPLIFVGSFEALGNTTDLQALSNFAFVQVTGQFVEENGIRKFNVESTNANVIQGYITGSLRKEGDQIILTSDDGNSEYVLLDPPADLPLNTVPTESYLGISGILVDNTLDWSNIQYVADASSMGGGGGGGGFGFYPLNLSGTPAVFPTPIPAEEQYSAAEVASFLNYIVEDGDTLESIAVKFNVSLEDLMRVNYISDMNVIETDWLIKIPGVPGPTQLTGEEGIVSISKYIKPDGRVRYQYTFLSSQSYNGIYYELQGDNLEPLQNLVNRPVKIWGDISYSDTGTMFLDVKQFEEIYPGLQFQILQGKEALTEINGKPVALFTTNGTTYVMLSEVGAYQDISYKGDFPEDINIEALIVPGETYEGMPALRVFSMANAKDPNTGEAIELEPFAGEIQSSPDPFGNSDVYVEPDFIVDYIQLEYYVTDPKMLYDAPTTDTLYIQPVWHFSGHYTNGTVSDILVQALKQEYLYPFNSP